MIQYAVDNHSLKEITAICKQMSGTCRIVFMGDTFIKDIIEFDPTRSILKSGKLSAMVRRAVCNGLDGAISYEIGEVND